MSNGADKPEVAKWDPGFTRQIANWVGPVVKRYFRAEVRDLDAMPSAGGALVVSNHSGGMFTPDVLVFAPAFYDRFGYDRPVYTLAHYGVFIGPLSGWLRRAGVIEASRENAAKALRDGAVVLVFPGGDYDSYRPTLTENVIDFAGRTGYVRTAIETGVPIVPMVSIGGQETQLFLARGRFDCQATRSHAGTHGDPAHQRRVPVRIVRDLPAQPAAAVQDRHPGA
jgi:1-acyl-sn-glycerol-3-phosphate acyltransferase